MPIIYERRYISSEFHELRAVQEGETKNLEGYAAVLNSYSEDLGGFREKIAPGAFKKTLKNEDVRALWNHMSEYVLGRKSAKTLSLREDEKGLLMKNKPPDTQWARDLLVSVERGDVREMSFGFNAISDKWEVANEQNERTLLEVRLIDVSPVTFAAYPQTEVQARSLFNALNLNTARLNQAMIRIEHRLDLLKGDKEIIEETIERLNSLLPSMRTHKDDKKEQEARTRKLAFLEKLDKNLTRIKKEVL